QSAYDCPIAADPHAAASIRSGACRSLRELNLSDAVNQRIDFNEAHVAASGRDPWIGFSVGGAQRAADQTVVARRTRSVEQWQSATRNVQMPELLLGGSRLSGILPIARSARAGGAHEQLSPVRQREVTTVAPHGPILRLVALD